MVDCIGNTPLVALKETDSSHARVYAKLELMNPFAMKDRVAKQAILEAKRTGELKDGAPIIESSSGTMALGVALVGTYLGHEVHIVTDPRIDPLTMTKLRALGCQIHIVEKMTSHGWQSARLEKLYQLMEEYPGAFWPRQYENPENPRAYRALVDEVMQDLDHVDVLVGAVGSGGSLSGTARELKKKNPHLRVVAVDAVGSVIFGQPDNPKRLQSGLGNSLIAPNVDFSVIDEVHWLNDAESFAWTWELARKEKIFAGNSSGSVYAVAQWLRTQLNVQNNILCIFPDSGDRYIHTIYNPEYLRQHGLSLENISREPQYVEYGVTVNSWSYSTLPQEAKVQVF